MSEGDKIVDVSTFGLLLATLVGFSNRAAEMAKAFLKTNTSLSAQAISALALLVSVIAGVVGAFFLNTNLLVLFSNSPWLTGVPPIVGVIGTGFLAATGSEGVMWFFDILKAKKTNMLMPTTSASVEVQAQSAPVVPVVIESDVTLHG